MEDGMPSHPKNFSGSSTAGSPNLLAKCRHKAGHIHSTTKVRPEKKRQITNVEEATF